MLYILKLNLSYYIYNFLKYNKVKLLIKIFLYFYLSKLLLKRNLFNLVLGSSLSSAIEVNIPTNTAKIIIPPRKGINEGIPNKTTNQLSIFL